MKPFPTFKAVIFDNDGLMLDTEFIAQETWKIAGAEFGYNIKDEIHWQVIGLTIADSRKTFKKVFGEDFPYDTIRKRRLEIGQEIFDQKGLPVKPGLLELLDFLDERHIPRAVATSTSREFIKQKFRAANIQNRFEIVVTGDDIVNGKPAPDIFLAAAEKLKIAPADCLVLEDSEPGIYAAKAAGMTPVMVPDLKPPSAEIKTIVHCIFESLHDVRLWLERHL